MHGFRARCFASPRNDESFPFVSHNGRIIFSRIPGQSGAARSAEPGIHRAACRRRGYGLLRRERNDNVDAVGATNQHDGQITKSLSTLLRENIPLAPSGKSVI